MGRASRTRPARLGKKLVIIRQHLGFSQTEMCKALELTIDYSAVSNYELGTREPTLGVLLKYAQLAGITTDFLIDDSLDLPESLPVKPAFTEQLKRLR